MKKIIVVILSLMLWGCASKQYFHAHITEPLVLENQKAIDTGLCKQVSAGTVPMPRSNYQLPNSSYSHSGTLTDGLKTYNYSGSSYSSGSSAFASGFAMGANIGETMEASSQREVIFDGCMRSKGWADSKEKAAALKSSVPQPKKQAAQDSDQQWQDTVKLFLDAEEALPGSFNYRTNAFNLEVLDLMVKDLANKPANQDKPMLWFLVEADRIVKEAYPYKK